LNLPIVDAMPVLARIEQQVRQVFMDRDRYQEAARTMQALLQQAAAKFHPDDMVPWQNAFEAAQQQALTVNFNTGYDAMTQLEAEFRAGLRQTEMPQTGNLPNGTTPEARQLRLKLNVDNLRRVLAGSSQHEPAS